MALRPLDWIREDKNGPFSSTRFDNLSYSAGATYTFAKMEGKEVSEALPTVARNAHFLHQDWGNMLTLVARIEWMHSELRASRLNEQAWGQFAALDIQHFHVELRSAFDYLARVVHAQSSSRKQTPENSYNKLSRWATENGTKAAELLGQGIADLVADSRQFFLLRKSIREQVVHSGALTLVFPNRDGVLFQVYTRGIQKQLLEGLDGMMHNENVVDFKAYASSTLLRFWSLVEGVSRETFRLQGLKQIGLGDGVSSHHSGLAVLREWSR